MFTNGPAEAVAASLAQVRRAAAEIVVAVDERVDPSSLGALQRVADRVVRAEFVDPLEANLGWLHRQATGDWILRLDGDDVPSEGLVRLLASPGWDRGITHAYVSYRWLWGGPDRMLDQAPWWPDPALRLIRNVPGIATFPTEAHQPPVVAGPGRLLDADLYHLDLLLADEGARAAKAVRYEHLAPGVRTDRGWSVSATYYLPERVASPPRTTPLPPVDAAVVSRVLAAARSAAPPTARVDLDGLGPVITAAQRRPGPPVPGDARIRLLAHPPLVTVTGRGTILTVGATNLGAQPWDPADEPAHQVGARFFDERGAPVGGELRAAFPAAVAPGEEGLTRLELPPVLPDGAKRLSVGLVQDGVAWHDAAAAIDLATDLGRRVLVSTGVSTFPHLGDDLITQEVLAALARHLPDVVPVLLGHPTDGLAARFGCEVATSPVAHTTPTRRGGDSTRRTRDLVVQARLMAMGDTPADPLTAAALEPFVGASAYIAAPGGGLASRYAEEALLVIAAEALIARAFGLPVFIEAPSVGPVELRRDHAALAQLFNDAARITVRDPASADAARRIGRAVDPLVVPDPATAAVAAARGPATAAARAWLADRNIPEGRAYAVFSLRGGRSDAKHLATIRRAAEALPLHTALVYLPHCLDPGGADDDLSLVATDEWAAAHLVPFDPALGMQAAVALIAGARITVGTRFHLSVVAAAAGVPAVALVADEYDRLRLRGLRRWPGLRMVDRDEPEAAGQAVVDLVTGPRPEPLPAWDPAVFATALGAVLPPAPRLA